MKVIHINKSDIRGGAARFAFALHQGLLKQNVSSQILVDKKYSSFKEVIALENDNYRGLWFKLFNGLAKFFLTRKFRGSWMFFKICRSLSIPVKQLFDVLGIDYFNYPGLKAKLPQLVNPANTIIQVYVAHGNYLDLRYIRTLSKSNIVVFRMPDAWLLSGHCAHSFECEKWKTGCGSCPDLTIPPKVSRDATAFNWKRKAELYKESRLHIVTPSHWLMNKVKQSMLLRGAVSLNVIPNGVDTEIFTPGSQAASRKLLGIDTEVTVLLFSANGIKRNRWKDFGQIQEILHRLSAFKFERQIEFIGLGDSGETELIGGSKVRYIKYQEDTDVLVHYYRSADIYIHPTKADSFPNSVLEALACGTLVIANAVGGIPEQIKPLAAECYGGKKSDWEEFDAENATGILVLPGDSTSFTKAIKFLITNQHIQIQMGKNARSDASVRFSQHRVTNEYLKLYRELSINQQKN